MIQLGIDPGIEAIEEQIVSVDEWLHRIKCEAFYGHIDFHPKRWVVLPLSMRS